MSHRNAKARIRELAEQHQQDQEFERRGVFRKMETSDNMVGPSES
jgi:hypothetical protein